MKASSIYGATPIKLDTFSDVESITGTITEAVLKNFDNGQRIVLTIDDDWSLVINGTAYRIIKKSYGDDTDDWIGLPITAYKGKLHYQGAEQDGVCVSVPPPSDERERKPQPATVSAADLTESGDGFKDDIPF